MLIVVHGVLLMYKSRSCGSSQVETAAPGSFESSFISGHPSKYTVTSDCACLEKPKKNPENPTSEKVCLVHVF